jgi:hypothetical protein
MAFAVTVDAVRSWLEDDTSLQTLKNQYTPEEVYALLEDKASIRSDDALYEALLDVMYATRPKGVT